MAKKSFNFSDMEKAPMTQAATETMANLINENQNENQNENENENENENKNRLNENQNENPIIRVSDNNAAVMTCIDNIAQRRMQIMAEYNGKAIQALSLKTFPEDGNWKMEAIVREFNNTRNRSVPKLTKGVLAEMLLLDAVEDMYQKVCKK